MKLYIAALALFVTLISCNPIRNFKSSLIEEPWYDYEDVDSVEPPSSTSPPQPITSAVQQRTTPAPSEFAACMQTCQITSQYNPVCGTNQLTYNNEAMLNCATRCGLEVTISFRGRCEPLLRRFN